MNKSQTKRALLLSVLSMLLCCTMLIGTTFAWFTDSVESGVNQIVAGNLDVELFSQKANANVNGDTKLFTLEKWEPGVVVWDNLTVQNLGTLALKYVLSLNVYEATEVDGHTLDEALKIGVVAGGVQNATREAVLAEVETWQAFESFSLKDQLLAAAADAKSEKTYGIVIWWEPTDADNNFNMNNENRLAGKTLSIKLGVKLAATQVENEQDSFDDQYDKDALVPETVYATIVENAPTVLTGTLIDATIPANATLTTDDRTLTAGETVKIEVKPADVNANVTVGDNATAEGYEISLLTEDGEKVTSDSELTVELNVGAGREGVVEIYHYGQKVVGSTYDKETGILTFTAKSFSPFTLVEHEIISEEAARALLDQGGVVDFHGAAMFNEIVGDNNYGANLREYTFKAGTVVKNLTLKGNSGATRWLHSEGNVTFENCIFDAPVYSCHFDSGSGSLTFKDCTFIGWTSIGSAYDNVLFENCEFYHSGRNGMARIYTNTQFKNCVFGDGMNVETGTSGLEFTIDGCEYNKEAVKFYQSEGSTVTVDGIDIFVKANKSWYNESDTAFSLTTREDLLGLAELVNAGNSFAGKTVALGADIDLARTVWTPIGMSGKPFSGTFDGASHTISNLTITGNNSNVGLFGFTTNGEIKNLTVKNADVSGYLNVAVVAGTPYTSKYTNITVTGDVVVNGFSYVGTVGGKNAYASWTDITVNVNEGSYVKAESEIYRTYVGGVIGFAAEGKMIFKNITSNIDVIGSTCDVGGITGIAHYGTTWINCSSSGTVTVNAATDEIGGIAGVWMNSASGDVTLEGCTFTGELVAAEGVDLSDNTLTGSKYSPNSDAGNLIIQ